MNFSEQRIFRSRLREITKLPVDEHNILFSSFSREFDNSIIVHPSSTPEATYTCAVYAFGLVGDEIYQAVATSGLCSTFAGRDFIDFLLSRRLLDLRKRAGSCGDLVIYFNRGVFEHVGILARHDRVISKWGVGLLIEHDLWGVPENYGDSVRYFKKLEKGEGIELFNEYAKQNGFEF